MGTFGADQAGLRRSLEGRVAELAKQNARLKKQRDEARRDHAVPGIYALGYALFYFKYCHPERDFHGQPARVHTLCERWVDLREREHKDMMEVFDLDEDPSDEEWAAWRQKWALEWDKLLEDIDDECENLC